MNIVREHRALADAVRTHAHPLREERDLDPLLGRIGDARIVLLGEASHGTHEYYTWRAKISRRLILEKGFNFIAVEGDWPDCFRVNRYIKDLDQESSGAWEVLRQFERWPTWMWANWEIVALSEWLKKHNHSRPERQKIGFYGLDLYSLWESMEAVLEHLKTAHPDKLQAGLEAFACFEPFNRDSQEYGWATRFGLADCEDELVQLLVQLRSAPAQVGEDVESHFDAEQNALAAIGAERYYRTMVRGNDDSWNIRDTHMADTLDRLLEWHGPESKAIVWEHNTHIGDARATDMADVGMINVGQLARERHARDGVVLVGFGSYEGSVVAGERWGAPMQKMNVPEAQAKSWEAILHEANGGDALLLMEDFKQLPGFDSQRGHRAIGVVYHSHRERLGNYVPTYLTDRYDAFLFLDKTKALHPLHLEPHNRAEPPETFPWGV